MEVFRRHTGCPTTATAYSESRSADPLLATGLGAAVTVTIPRLTGPSVFGGTLNATQDTFAGTITREIDLGNLYILLASGDLTFERVAS
jgi:hypothetical protein